MFSRCTDFLNTYNTELSAILEPSPMYEFGYLTILNMFKPEFIAATWYCRSGEGSGARKKLARPWCRRNRRCGVCPPRQGDV